MGWNGSPAAGTRRASIPARLPIQWMSAVRSLRAAATASPALVCPPVPPPAITTRIDGSGLCPPLHGAARNQLELARVTAELQEPPHTLPRRGGRDRLVEVVGPHLRALVAAVGHARLLGADGPRSSGKG